MDDKDEDWKVDLKKKSRACLIIVKNRTHKKFVKVGVNLNHGKFRREPADVIEALGCCEFGVEGRTPLTGTQGSVQYEIQGTENVFLLYWYNPKVGKPKVGFAVSPPYSCVKSGNLDKYSEITFEILEKTIVNDSTASLPTSPSLSVSSSPSNASPSPAPAPITPTSSSSSLSGTSPPQHAEIQTKTGDQITKYYRLTNKILGSGTFSQVKVGIDKKTNEKVAIKIVDKQKSKKENLEREVNILKKVHHPNIVQLKDLFESPDHLFIVMELVDGMELFDKVMSYKNANKLVPEKISSNYIRQSLEAVAYLHEHKIVHRDIKPENLLLDSQGNLKLTDFGLSSLYSPQGLMLTCCGTPDYVAPEVLKCEMGGYDMEADMWSLGVVLYFMLCEHLPFDNLNQDNLFESIMRGDYDFPEQYWANVSDAAKDLVQHLLVVDPVKRYTAKQALQHPWITEHNK